MDRGEGGAGIRNGAPPDATGDLTARVSELQQELLETTRLVAELEGRDRLKTQFLANISHDLRTPLTAIITHAEIIRDGILGDLTDRQRESIQGIIGGGRQLLDMVGEILTYAKSAANQLELAISEFHLEDVLAQLLSLNESLLAKKALTFEVRAKDDLPPLRADRDKISHVIGNLLGNAIAFTPRGGRVWIAADVTDDEGRKSLLVEVGDTGIGIAPEHHDLVFREFAQVDSSASRSHHGTGLGLTIARKLVELHGGRIWVESQLREGSRFYFTVPMSQG